MSYVVTFEKNGQVERLFPDELADEDEIAYEINAKTKLTVLVYPQFPAWGFPEKQTIVNAFADRSGALEFHGRVTDIQDSMDSEGRYCRRVTCASEMDFLDDTRVSAAAAADTRAAELAAELIAAHNTRLDGDTTRQFSVGTIATAKTLGTALAFDYCTTLDALKKIFIDTLGMEIRTRYVNGVNYFDAAASFGTVSDMVIKIGDNLKSVRATYSAADKLITRLIPLGGVGYNGKRLTIAPVNDDTIYIDNAELIAQYGIHEGVLIVNELAPQYYGQISALAQKLYDIGAEEAAALGTPAVTISLSTLDLQKLGLSGYSAFAAGNTYYVICPKLGLFRNMRVTALKRRLADEKNVSLTISSGSKRREIKVTSLSRQLADYTTYYSDYLDDVDRKRAETEQKQLELNLDGLKLKKLTAEEYEELVEAEETDPNTIYTVVGEDPVTGEPTAEQYLGDTHISEGGGGDDGIPYPAEMIYVLDTACFGFAASCSLQSVSAGAAWVEGSWDRQRVEVSGETKEIVVPVSNDRAQRTTIYPDSDYLYFDIESGEYLSYTGYCVDSTGYYIGMVSGYTKLRTTPQIKASARWIAISGLPAGTVAVHLWAGRDYGTAVRGDTVYYLG